MGQVYDRTRPLRNSWRQAGDRTRPQRKEKRMKGKIVLETGEVFEGNIVCGSGIMAGKLVFDTRVVGYEKVLTSPEYSGKIVCFTYPLIGNYGVCNEDTETDRVFPPGIIICEYSEIYSNFRAECSLKDFLNGKPASLIEGIDTQNITERTRENRNLWAAVAPADAGVNGVLKEIRDCKNGNGKEPVYKGRKEKQPVVKKGERYAAVLDLGLKKSELAMLGTSGLELAVLTPDESGVAEIMASAAGIYVSSGIEDVKTIEKTAELIKTVLGRVPLFAAGLGHVITGLSCGGAISGETVNHYGVNQPVLDRKEKKCYITEQAHSLILEKNSVSGITRYVNVNDGTVEGLEDRDKKIITTSFQPAENNFREFFSMIKGQ